MSNEQQAPANDGQERSQLLATLRDSMETCLKNSTDKAKPQEYRLMMEHFAEAGRQVIEMIEERRYSGSIFAHICEGCNKPTVVVQVSDDDIVLCPLCYAATPVTALDDGIRCPHCHWRPSPDLKPVNGSYKCANCDLRWIAQPPSPQSEEISHCALCEDPGFIYRDCVVAAQQRGSELQREALIELIADFDNWEWCKCSECRLDGRSHAVNTQGSLANLVNAARAAKQPGLN